MRNNNEWFGLALYSPNIDESGVGDWVDAALIESGGEVCGVQLAQFSIASVKGNFGKMRRFDERNLKDLLNRSRQGKVNMIYGYDVELGPHTSLFGLEILYFEMTATLVYSSEIRELTVMGPKKLYNDVGVMSYVRRLVSRFGVSYGCIVSGLTRRHTDATITYIHSSDIEDVERLRAYGPDHPRKQFGKEISYYQSKRRKLDQYIPRACWGNILSPSHIEALGGEEKIRQESKAYLVERWGDNLYLQLTKSLWKCTNDDLRQFNRYLAPARFPDAPEPVYLDRSSKAYIKY
ncbi:MAG: hypothetical protein ABFD64_01630 [Armatimonadota bacterium]